MVGARLPVPMDVAAGTLRVYGRFAWPSQRHVALRCTALLSCTGSRADARPSYVYMLP